MMGNFNLIVQHPKPQKPINGVLCISKRGEAQFFSGNGEANSQVLGEMERVRVEHASSNGIFISGVERIGTKYRLQEWWLVYVKEVA